LDFTYGCARLRADARIEVMPAGKNCLKEYFVHTFNNAEDNHIGHSVAHVMDALRPLDKLTPIVDSYVAAANNELIRLISACYKEGYLHASDGVSFSIESDAGNFTVIDSLDSALDMLYDARIKDGFRINARFDGADKVLSSTEQLFDLLRPFFARAFPQLEINDERWKNWLDVSRHAVKNEALAIADKILLDASIEPYGSVLHYAAGLPANGTFAFFCRYAAYFGRFDMPFSKMKLPVSNDEALRYAPEFGHDVPIRLAAVHGAHVVSDSVDGITTNALIRQEFPAVYARWEQAIVDRGSRPEHYVALPVHPLSLSLFETRLGHLIINGELILDTGATIVSKAGLSYRTMIPVGEESGLSIKLAVPLQLTGYIRYIDIEELRSAPRLSKLLATIFEAENNFGGRLRLDRELVTARIVPRSDSAWSNSDAQYFSCLIRENQSRGLAEGSVTMPLAAIFSASSISGKPILIEAMEFAGVTTQELALGYFGDYLRITLNSVLRMYLRHGVMLEAHQQNMGLTFNSLGHVDMLHYHDIACAVFFYRPAFIAAGHYGPGLQGLSHPYASDDSKNSCTQFVHTVLLLNILPVVDMIANGYDIQKERLYRLAYQAIATVLAEERHFRNAQEGVRSAIFARFHREFEQQVLASPTFNSKRLLGRLLQQSQTRSWGKIPNPDPDFSAIKGSAVPIVNPLHAFHAEYIADLQPT